MSPDSTRRLTRHCADVRVSGDSITSTTTKLTYTVLDLGILSPKEISISENPKPESRVLRKGMVGWLVCSMKDVKDGKSSQS